MIPATEQPSADPAVDARETTTLVALLTWTYQKQKAEAMSGRGLWEQEKAKEGESRQHWSGCGCAQLAAVAVLGARIAPGGWQRPVLHPDAERVHEAVIASSRSDWPGAILLRQYALRGDMPDWRAGQQHFEPVYDAQDRIVQDRFDEMAESVDKRGRRRMVPVAYCPLAKYPPDEWVTAMREEYAVWHRALCRLDRMLARQVLLRWRVTGLGAESAPWRFENKT